MHDQVDKKNNYKKVFTQLILRDKVILSIRIDLVTNKTVNDLQKKKKTESLKE
jgi:hypothetical protein